ncbi:MAG TPA: metalloregulator ArsR/SmtB family transcription factor [Solirubrobacteraceae bacterium]|jgi:DNA-binding transcriptional ArsR family regulator|nr:metalloregulator ArsR/SmtB family transcription factor [Solirubrobacteraceae bacterium]
MAYASVVREETETPTAAKALTALADPTRRVIFERVAERPSAVVELAAGLPVSRPAVSQHLKVLADGGLVSCHRAGNRHIYSLDPQGVEALHVYLERFWKRSLAAFKAAAELPASEHYHPDQPDQEA